MMKEEIHSMKEEIHYKFTTEKITKEKGNGVGNEGGNIFYVAKDEVG